MVSQLQVAGAQCRTPIKKITSAAPLSKDIFPLLHDHMLSYQNNTNLCCLWTSQQGMCIPHKIKVVLKPSLFRKQMWTVAKWKNASEADRGLFLSYHSALSVRDHCQQGSQMCLGTLCAWVPRTPIPCYLSSLACNALDNLSLSSSMLATLILSFSSLSTLPL